ncbi:hypothetical protein [Actinocatenispora sera]|uniref:Uncharacterized protein n=1 Tax=Actinocatenispora sera TaxID=390989 RepID=A0A810L2P1_9ACTN|nr:hypothetical protein [Actinocatenispora sera]BCJ29165.1 hypothetical protein Asera_32730 [Actinocatenispora sera]
MAHAAVRDEARLLVTGVLAAASRAASGWPGQSGCRCPLCRAAAAVREPDPQLSERLADAVGTVADGVAGLLRAWSDGATGPDGTAPAGGSSEDESSRGGSSGGAASGGAAAAGPTGGAAAAAGEPADGGMQTKGDVGCQ